MAYDTAKAKASIRGHKLQMQLRTKEIDKLLTLSAVRVTSSVVEALKEELAFLEEQKEKEADLYDAIINSSEIETEVAEARQRSDEVNQYFGDKRLKVLRAEAEAEAAAGGGAGAAGAGAGAGGAGAGVAGAGGAGAVRAGPQAKEAAGLKPERLSLENTPAEFKSWQAQFQAYFGASHFEVLGLTEQRAYLLNCLEHKLAARLREHALDVTPIWGAHGCMEFLEGEFKAQYPLFLRRHQFFSLRQKMGETFSDFAVRLRQVGDGADLHNMGVDQLYVFRYVGGTADEKLREKFLKETDPTFEALRAVARAHEVAQRGNSSLSEQKEVVNLAQDKPKLKCFRCGKDGHASPKCSLEASAVTCGKCGKAGHMDFACEKLAKLRKAAAARRQGGAQGGGPRQDSKPEQAQAQLNSIVEVSEVRGPGATPRRLEIFRTMHKSQARVQRFQCEVLPDTGATRSILSKRVAESQGLQVQPSDCSLKVANSERMEVLGCVTLLAEKAGSSGEDVKVSALVADIEPDMLLGWQECQSMGIISTDFPASVHQVEEAAQQTCDETPQSIDIEAEKLKETLLEEYADVLHDKLEGGVMRGEPMHIFLDENADIRPARVKTAKPIPLHMREPAEALVKNLLTEKVIAKEAEPTNWCSSARFVEKPGGGVRLVTDYRQLNKYVQRPVHPFPSTKDIIQNLPSATSSAKAPRTCVNCKP